VLTKTHRPSHVTAAKPSGRVDSREDCVQGFGWSAARGSIRIDFKNLISLRLHAASLFTVPVALGGGKKLFADGSAPHSFKLTSSRVSSTGILVGHYERDGEIKIGGTSLDSPSKREIARQERMKHEG
jgi:hypothetical protein